MDRSDLPDVDSPIPIMEEVAAVSKRTVTTGVTTIDKQVESHDYLVSELLQRQNATVERVAFGTVVDAANPPSVRTEQGVTIIPVLEEVLVVEKRLVLKEEVHIRHHTEQVPTTQTVTLRNETVVVTHHDDLDAEARLAGLPSPLQAENER